LVILVYFILTFRLYVAAKNAYSIFGKLLVVGVGFPVVFQAVVNMTVATNLGPVTGQTLPLISSGGTSIWMTCLAIGMVLSVTAAKKEEEIKKEEVMSDAGIDSLENLEIEDLQSYE